ncbi:MULTISPECIES: hypothetical protein [unclassified Mesorhizobium]|nr:MULTISPECIES: hypothetical protein [unclassified Mesorhizobium]ESW98930.1 hypothetical protein X768_31670 [Mesorhizobium sp. LSJC265A00]ESY05208.1 hypothetical protein X753_15215 [Mesorhizobium sp. LNJC399B00]WJI70050.1 hypothetical protein NLY36_04390 [Mesorhizobium sp. C399B]
MQLIFDDHAFVVPIDKRLNDGEAATVFGNGDEVVVTQVEDHLLVADGNTFYGSGIFVTQTGRDLGIYREPCVIRQGDNDAITRFAVSIFFIDFPISLSANDLINILAYRCLRRSASRSCP